MATQLITIIDGETGKQENIDTTGFLLLYFSKYDKIEMTGKLDIKILAPIISKAILERISH